ncbi:glycoside hydrolase family 88 protein [uncultured Bacteroides sp.]|uniref:glycoside hydrolase family 88/105 protein n=1 Tax=uncultured Bacteroides sp. TaxID=162156 RepID=UPI0026087788|nr:glycoside hydrolase family 88 protein [uncultured Bacteroides sp.]
MKTLFLSACLFMASLTAGAQTTTRYSQEMARSQGKQWTHGKPWDYVNGLVAKSLLNLCEQYNYADWTLDYYQWAKDYADTAINPDGTFKNFKKGNIDNINSGKVLFALYKHEKELDAKNGTNNADRYKKAADFLHEYLTKDYSRIQSGDAKGCFFHKDIYPNQMWLDGLYMGAAFYAEWLGEFDPDNTAAWSDIAHQFITINRHTYDAKKQLNYHAWSNDPEDANSFWANKAEPFKGCSKEFWGRGMGWYFAALIDVLEDMPESHPDYKELKKITLQVAKGLAKWQDKESGVWYQLLQYDDSYKSECGIANYLESSASSMFTYAYLKGVRLGILPKSYAKVADKAYKGLLKTFVTKNEDGTINLNQSCRSAGLGPAKDPSRDGSADYYLCGKDVKIVSNEGKALGPFIMASLEYELANK